ncbi:MAG: ABC transporter permease [Burkholderiales bacterium]
MLVFILRRSLQAFPVVLGVSLAVFLLVHMMPGSAIDVLLPPEASQELVDRIKSVYGFDRPIWERYFIWLVQVGHGDLGTSVFSGRPIAPNLLEALFNTLQLAFLSAGLGFTLGIVLGFLAGTAPSRFADKALSAFAIVGVSVPHYWLGIVLVVVFSVLLNWLPAQGMGAPGFPASWEQIQHLILPVVTLSLIPMGIIARVVRATTLDVVARDFVASLDARGLHRRTVLAHVAKNAAPAVLALMGLQFGYLVGGSILIETVFNWPGVGHLLNLAIFRRDIAVIQATILMLALFFVIINLAVDVMQAVVDPRMRRG